MNGYGPTLVSSYDYSLEMVSVPEAPEQLQALECLCDVVK